MFRAFHICPLFSALPVSLLASFLKLNQLLVMNGFPEDDKGLTHSSSAFRIDVRNEEGIRRGGGVGWSVKRRVRGALEKEFSPINCGLSDHGA